MVTDVGVHLQKLSINNEGTKLMVLNSLKKMVNLTELELVRCDLERIPHSIFSLHNLQVRLHLVPAWVQLLCTIHNYWNGACI